MRITSVETGRRPVHLRLPFRTALREVKDFEVVTVSVRAEGGVTGCSEVVGTARITGETNASIEEAVNTVLAPVLIGRDLGDYCVALADTALAMVGNSTAKCGIDVAVHRAVAAWRGTALSEVLGATLRPIATDVTVSLATPSDMAAEASRRVDEGFGTLKLKVGGPVALDIERVRAVAGAVPGNVALRIDANQAWTARQALQVIDGLVQAGVVVEFIEQPVPATDLAGLAAVTARSPVPVVADESAHTAADVRRLADAGACDVVNIKLAKCGGLQAALEVAAVARAYGLGLLFGSMMEAGSGVAATAVLASRLAPDHVHDLDAGWWTETESAAIYRPPFVLCDDKPPAASGLQSSAASASVPCS
jgi:L-alanine-DL-glutamate epimerase-like enolase superfamily enzyme